MPRHGLSIMGDEHSTVRCSSCQYLRIGNPGQTRCHRGLKIDRWLPSYRRQQDDLVEISIRLKAHPHGLVRSCRTPAGVRELLVEHRVLLTGDLAHGLELRFGFFEI